MSHLLTHLVTPNRTDRNRSEKEPVREPSADELWDRAMQATKIYLSGEFADQPTLQAEHMVAAMMNWSLEKVRMLDPKRLAETNLDVVRTVGHVLVFLSKVPASESAPDG